MEKRFKFGHVNELTGLFVLAGVTLAVAAVIFSGHSQRWFTRKYAFDVRLPEQGASGLRRGDDVFIQGVLAGFVNDIRVAHDDRLNARVKIDRAFERFLRVDSTASIKKVFGVAGDSFMEITRGTGAALPERDPAIACLASEDSLGRMERMFAEMRSELMPVVGKAGAAFDEWTKLGGDLRKHGEQVSQLVARLDKLVIGVEEGKGTAGQLFTDTALADEGRRLLTRANEAMGEWRSVATNLDAAVADLRKGSARLPEVAEAVANEARDLPGLVQQTQASMRELERLTEALQRHWLLRKYVNKTNPPPVRPPPVTQKPIRQPLRSPRGSNSK